MSVEMALPGYGAPPRRSAAAGPERHLLRSTGPDGDTGAGASGSEGAVTPTTGPITGPTTGPITGPTTGPAADPDPGPPGRRALREARRARRKIMILCAAIILVVLALTLAVLDLARVRPVDTHPAVSSGFGPARAVTAAATRPAPIAPPLRSSGPSTITDGAPAPEGGQQ